MRKSFFIFLIATLLSAEASAMPLIAKRVAMIGNNFSSKDAFNSFIARQSPTLDLIPGQKTTTVNTYAVSQIDSVVGTVSFAQATEANSPLLTSGGSLENLASYSDDITQTSVWTETRATSGASGETNPLGYPVKLLTENTDAATSHLTEQDTISVTNGVSYRMCVQAKPEGMRNVLLRPLTGFPSTLAYFQLTDCTLAGTGGTTPLSTSIESIGDGWCRACVTQAATSTATSRLLIYITNASNSESYNGDGVSGLNLTAFSFNRTTMTNAYFTTAAHPLIGSLTGNPGLAFRDNSDTLTSATTLAGVLGASAKTYLMVYDTNVAAEAQTYFQDSSAQFSLKQNTSSQMSTINDDGSADSVVATSSAATPHVWAGYHDGTTLAGNIDNGVFVTAASGATAATTGTLELSDVSTNDVNGRLYRLVLFDKVLPVSVIRKAERGARLFYRIN